MILNQLEDVAVHDERENTQQKDEANLDESLFHGDAQIPTESPFNRQHEEVAAVEDRNRKEIQKAKISEIEVDVTDLEGAWAAADVVEGGCFTWQTHAADGISAERGILQSH